MSTTTLNCLAQLTYQCQFDGSSSCLNNLPVNGLLSIGSPICEVGLRHYPQPYALPKVKTPNVDIFAELGKYGNVNDTPQHKAKVNSFLERIKEYSELCSAVFDGANELFYLLPDARIDELSQSFERLYRPILNMPVPEAVDIDVNQAHAALCKDLLGALFGHFHGRYADACKRVKWHPFKIAKFAASDECVNWLDAFYEQVSLAPLPADVKVYVLRELNTVFGLTIEGQRIEEDNSKRGAVFTGYAGRKMSKRHSTPFAKTRKNPVVSKLEQIDQVPEAIKPSVGKIRERLAELNKPKTKQTKTGTNSENQQQFENDRDATVVLCRQRKGFRAYNPKTGWRRGIVVLPIAQPETVVCEDQPADITYPLINKKSKIHYLTYEVAINERTHLVRVKCLNKDPVLPTNLQSGIPADDFLEVLLAHNKGQMSLNAAVSHLKGKGIKASKTTIYNGIEYFDNCLFEILSSLEGKIIKLANPTGHMDEGFLKVSVRNDDAEGNSEGERKQSKTLYVFALSSGVGCTFNGVIYRCSDSRSYLAAVESMGDVLTDIKSLVSDRFAIYNTLCNHFEIEGQFCFAHLLRELMMAVDKHMEKWKKDEADYIKQLKKAGEYDSKNGLTSEQQKVLSKRLDLTWSKFKPAVKSIFLCAYCICQLFAAEHLVIEEWKQAFNTHKAVVAETGNLPDDARKEVLNKVYDLRQELCKPLVEFLDEQLFALKDCRMANVKKAVNYYLNGRDKFKTFLDNPELGIDNNMIERQIKHISALRKNNVITQSKESLKRACNFLTCYRTMRMQGFDDQSFINMSHYMLDRLLTHTIEQGVKDWFDAHGNLDKVHKMIYTISPTNYLSTFPMLKHFVTFYKFEQDRVYQETGELLPGLPEQVINQMLREEEAQIANLVSNSEAESTAAA